MGRKQSVSSNIGVNKLLSVVKGFSNGGAYIPVPKVYVGRKVEVLVLQDSVVIEGGHQQHGSN